MHSSKFVAGAGIFIIILLTMLIYPLINPGNPLEMIGVGTFARPGLYFSLYDAMDVPKETLKLSDAEDKRLESIISKSDRVEMLAYFEKTGVDVTDVTLDDVDTILDLWNQNFDENNKPKGLTNAAWRNYKTLNNRLHKIGKEEREVYDVDPETGEENRLMTVNGTDYINVSRITNTKRLVLGTDNFGRDVLKELVSACGTSILIGLIAGAVATFIGLLFGLLAGYLGGWVDDFIMFLTNVFTVIPSFVLLILISYSIGQEQRGATVVAIVIGLTSWTWTARSVRSQVISLRNRDHVNLSKLSGHSLFRIVVTDILPYIASYVVMAFILQVSSGILSEAQLSLLGLGPKTTTTPTLGLMMNWAMLYAAHTNGYWWAYFPVILTITLISFSLNLMNTGMDQVFNPTLRD